MKRTTSQTEKKTVYSTCSLKNGTGSVVIGASLVLLAMATPTISANETTTALAQPLTDTAVHSDKKESDISSPKNANVPLEKTEEKFATETPNPAATPSDSVPQIGQDHSS